MGNLKLVFYLSNKSIKTVWENAFLDCKDTVVYMIDLSFNQIELIKENSFYGLINLILSFNKISVIEEKSFKYLPQLKTIDWLIIWLVYNFCKQ